MVIRRIGIGDKNRSLSKGRYFSHSGCTCPANNQICILKSGCHITEKRLDRGLKPLIQVSRFHHGFVFGSGLMHETISFPVFDMIQGVHHCHVNAVGALASTDD